jgi:hypothetical protein
MVKGQCWLPAASTGMREEAASWHSQTGLRWLSLLFHFKSGNDPAEGELLIALLACHLEVVVGKLTIGTVVMLDPDTVLGSELFKCLFGLINSNKLRLLVVR